MNKTVSTSVSYKGTNPICEDFTLMTNYLPKVLSNAIMLGVRILTYELQGDIMAQMVKDLPAMQETWARFLAWGNPLEEGIETHSSILAWRIPTDRGAWRATVLWVAKSQTQLSD